jgi:tetratricopeptide (TPR) repeat protein
MAEQVDRLAHHAVRGEVWTKALVYCRQAGEKAMARPAYREAVGYFEQALSALTHLPETRATREQAIDLRLAMRTALSPSGDNERILAYLHEAEALAATLDDPRRLGHASLFLAAQLAFGMGAYDQAIAVSERVLTLAMGSRDLVLQGLAHQNLGNAYRAQGVYQRAIDCFGHTVAFLDGAWRRRERFGQVFLPEVSARAWLAWCHADLGTFAAGCVLGEEALHIAEAAAHPVSLMIASWGSGLLALRQGDLAKALPRLEQAMGICQDIDSPATFPLIAAVLGTAYTLCRRVADAVPLLTQAIEQPPGRVLALFQAPPLLSLGEAYLLHGRSEEAHVLAARALAHAHTHQERGNQAYALHLLGDIAAHHSPPDVDQAAAHYRQALDLADELGMRPLAAHCHRGLGLLYSQIGRGEQARAALSAAIELYRAMDMTFWLPQTEAALAYRGKFDG